MCKQFKFLLMVSVNLVLGMHVHAADMGTHQSKRGELPAPMGNFMRAIERGDLAYVQKHVNNVKDLESYDTEGNTPFAIAVKRGHKKIAEILSPKASTAALYNIQEDGELRVDGNALSFLHKSAYEKFLKEASFIVQFQHALSTANSKKIINAIDPRYVDCSFGTNNITLLSLIAINKEQLGLQKSKEIVSRLIAAGADPNKPFNNGMTLLSRAQCRNDFPWIRFLIECGATKTGNKDAPLLPWLIFNNQFDCAHKLIDRGFDIHEKTQNQGISALMTAAIQGRCDLVQKLIDQGARINDQDDDGQTALYWAVDKNQSAVVSLLLRNGAQWSICSKEGTSPLSRATGCCAINVEDNNVTPSVNKAVIDALLSGGVNINAFDSMGSTALAAAIINKHTDYIYYLMDRGARMDVVDKEGQSAVQIACRMVENDTYNRMFNEDELISFLRKYKECGADLTSTDTDAIFMAALSRGYIRLLEWVVPYYGIDINRGISSIDNLTPLLLAVARPSTEKMAIVEALLRLGANSQQKIKGITVADASLVLNEYALASVLGSSYSDIVLLMQAVKSNKIEDVRYFVEKRGVDVNSSNEYGITPLSIASDAGHKGLVLYLLEHGASVACKTRSGWLPWELAEDSGHKDIVQIFKDHAEKCGQELCLQENDEITARLKRLALKAAHQKKGGMAAVGGAPLCEKTDEPDDDESDEDCEQRYLQLYINKLNKNLPESHTQLSKKVKNPVNISRKKELNIARCVYADRVAEWFDNPAQALTRPEYAAHPETLYDEIIFRHNGAQILDQYIHDYALHKGNDACATVLALCIIIRHGKKELRVLECAVDKTGDKPVLFHRYFNKLDKHPDIKMSQFVVPRTTKPTDLSEMRITQCVEDRSYVVNKTDDVVEVYDPKSHATIFMCKPKAQ